QERAVAPEHEDEVDVPRELGLEHCGGRALGAQRGRLLLEDDGEIARRAPVEQIEDDPASLLAVGLREQADALHAGSSAATRSIAAPSSGAVRPVRARCTKNSRFPLGPLSGDAVTPRTCQPWRIA